MNVLDAVETYLGKFNEFVLDWFTRLAMILAAVIPMTCLRFRVSTACSFNEGSSSSVSCDEILGKLSGQTDPLLGILASAVFEQEDALVVDRL